jgi:NAD-dependent deacetylase
MPSPSDHTDRLKALLAKSKRAVVFTGAGISTESGIPDFRSPGGIWTKMQPIDFRDFVGSADVRREAWRRRFDGGDKLVGAKPNKGHIAVARLVRDGKVSAVITQNVDSLHQQSGVPDSKMIELHGNASYAKCLSCHRRYELAYIKGVFDQSGDPPDCQCGGIIKSATISFGQSMPEAEMERAQEETLQCDLFMAIGSSLVVYPAAGFPLLAKRSGAKLVILNREPTDQDSYADLVINAEIGQTLTAAVGLD